MALLKMSCQLMLTSDGLWFVEAEKTMVVDITMKLEQGE